MQYPISLKMQDFKKVLDEVPQQAYENLHIRINYKAIKL